MIVSKVRADPNFSNFSTRRFEFQKRTPISHRRAYEIPSIVALRVRNPD